MQQCYEYQPGQVFGVLLDKLLRLNHGSGPPHQDLRVLLDVERQLDELAERRHRQHRLHFGPVADQGGVLRTA